MASASRQLRSASLPAWIRAAFARSRVLLPCARASHMAVRMSAAVAASSPASVALTRFASLPLPRATAAGRFGLTGFPACGPSRLHSMH